MNLKEIKIDSKIVYEGKIMRVVQDQVKCPNGQISFREVVRHNGGACILAITKENKILLEEQFRYAYDEIIYEIPAGKLEFNEDPMEAAIRELEEETGYRAKSIHSLGKIYPTVGYSNEILHLYYTQDIYYTKTNLDPDEVVIVHEVTFKEALEMIVDGRIKDAKTICAIYNYLQIQGKINI